MLIVQVLLNSFYLKTYEGEGISNDGSFGPATYRKLKVAQKYLGLAQDGFVGLIYGEH